MDISELVTKTIASGVPPLDILYYPVYDTSEEKIIAYRSQVMVNSIELGVIGENDFYHVSDSDDVGTRLSFWHLNKVAGEIKAFADAERNLKWVSVYCSPNAILSADFYERVKAVAKKLKSMGKIKLCLEFSEKLLDFGEKATRAILDLKILGVESYVIFGSQQNMPIFKLVDIPVSGVILPVRFTSLVNDRNKPEVVSSFVKFLSSLHVGVLATGIENSDQRREFSRIDAFGYMNDNEQGLILDEAVLQKEGND